MLAQTAAEEGRRLEVRRWPLPDDGPPALLAQIVDLDELAILVVAEGEERARHEIAFANRTFAALTGLGSLEVRGRPLGLLRAETTDPRAFARLLQAIERQEPVHLPLEIRAGDRTLWTEVDGQPLSGPGRPYLLRLRDVTGARAAGHGEREERRHLAALAELTTEGVYHLRVGPDCRLVLDWTAGAFARLTGYGAAEIEAQGGWTALVEPADLRAVQKRAVRLLAGEEAGVEYRVRARDGRRRWLRDVGRPEWDEARELVVGALCVVQDISEQRRLEEDLRAQQLDRMALIGFTGGLVLRVDPAGRVREVGGRARGELGARLQAATGRRLEDVVDAEAAALWRDRMQQVLPGWPPVTFELGHRTATSEERYRVWLAAAGGGSVLALILIEPPRLPALPAAPDRPDPRLRALLESRSVASVLLSPALVVEELNAAAEALTGWQRAGALGRPFAELLKVRGEDERVVRDLEEARAGTLVRASETWVRLPGGQEGRLLWSYTPLKDPAGTVIAILAQGEAIAPGAVTMQGVDDGARMRAIIDHVADGVLSLDAHGRIIGFSRSAERIFGYRRDAMLGREIDALLVLDGGGTLAERLLRAGRPLGDTLELLARRKGGELVPLEVAISDVPANGEMISILTVRDVSVRKQTEETIRSLAYHDALTGLPNRLLFHDRLTQAIERARRGRQALAVMILDLDRFKLINDSLGLASGDRVLRLVGERLAGAVRKSDTVARLGADDFLVLLPGVDGAEGAAKVAQKLLQTLQPLLALDGQELHVDGSIGIALYPHDGEDAETLIRNADTALYRAKERSRGSYQFYTTDMNATAFERLMLETQLRKAVERDELSLFYQPQVRIESGAVVGVEALLRWRHPELGLIPPAQFIPLAEETGLILPIGRWVLETACAQVRRWQDQGFAGLRVAVNLSGRQFQQADLVEVITDVLSRTGLAPAALDLELTESSIMQDAEATVAKCEALDRLGIRLSVDDFGTGYSSLGYLKRFPIKALKIDHSFIRDITSDPNDAAIAQAIVALAGSLQLRVIAEGVETEPQLALLRSYGCDEMQGYLFARPLPPDELFAVLQSGRRIGS